MVDSKRFDFSFMGQNELKKSEKYAIMKAKKLACKSF